MNLDVDDAIVAAVRAGNYANVAAAAAGIHRSTYFAWINRGQTRSSARWRRRSARVRRWAGDGARTALEGRRRLLRHVAPLGVAAVPESHPSDPSRDAQGTPLVMHHDLQTRPVYHD
jgi:hypothetical protein